MNRYVRWGVSPVLSIVWNSQQLYYYSTYVITSLTGKEFYHFFLNKTNCANGGNSSSDTERRFIVWETFIIYNENAELVPVHVSRPIFPLKRTIQKNREWNETFSSVPVLSYSFPPAIKKKPFTLMIFKSQVNPSKHKVELEGNYRLTLRKKKKKKRGDTHCKENIPHIPNPVFGWGWGGGRVWPTISFS